MLVLVVLFLAWRSARKATVHRLPMELPGAIELGPGSITESSPALVGAGVGAHAAQAVALPEPPRQIEPPKPLISDQLVEMIDQQPDDVAQMLRGWLADRRS